MRTLISATTLLLALTACGGGDDGGDEGSDLSTTQAGEECDLEDAPEGYSMNWDDESLSLNVAGSAPEQQAASIVTVQCIVDELDGPSSINERVASTRALDGQQSEEWDGFEANWSYSGSDSRLVFTIDAR